MNPCRCTFLIYAGFFAVLVLSGCTKTLEDLVGGRRGTTKVESSDKPVVWFESSSLTLSEDFDRTTSVLTDRTLTSELALDFTYDDPNSRLTSKTTSIQIPAGVSAQSFTIHPLNDNVYRGNGSATITVSTSNSQFLIKQNVLTLTILEDDPAPTISIADTSVNENAGFAVLTLTKTGATALPASVQVSTANGTAIAGTDYTSTVNQLVTFAANETTKTISIPILDNSMDENDRTFTATISTPVDCLISATQNMATVTITDDDPAPTVQFSAANQIAVENAGAVTVTLNLSAASGKSIAVPFTMSGTAVSPSHYTVSANPVTIPAGATSVTITMTLVDNSTYEADRTIIATLGTPTNAVASGVTAHTITLRDDEIIVAPYFPVNGANWNSYVEPSVDSVYYLSRYFKAGSEKLPLDVACTDTMGCLHAGEIRKVVYAARSSCTGLTAADSESALEWRCHDTTSPLFFYSVGFKKGKGLKNLINATGTDFKDLRVTISQGATTLKQSALAKWWTNTVSPLNTSNTNSGGAAARLSFNTANTIYAVTENISSRGINIGANGVALVVLPGAKLSPTGTLSSIDCRPYWPSGVQNCFVFVQRIRYLWIEGDIGNPSAASTIISDQVTWPDYSYFIRIHASKLSGTSSTAAMYLNGGAQVSDTDISGAYSGIAADGSWYAHHHDIKIQNVTGSGFDTGWLSAYSKLLNIQVVGAGAMGINASGQELVVSHFSVTNSLNGMRSESQRSAITDGIFAGNTQSGLYSTIGSTSLHHITAAHNGAYGIDLNAVTSTGTQNVLSANNNYGIRLSGYLSSYYGLSAIDNSTNEIVVPAGAENALFGGRLNLGRTAARCSIGAGTVNVGVTSADCTASAGTTIARLADINGQRLFQGYQLDFANGQGLSGISGLAFGSILDWFTFHSPIRTWLKQDFGAWPNSNLRGRCSSGTCGLYDHAMAGTSDLFEMNGAFQKNVACPAITKGSNAMTDYYNDAPNLVIQGAVEYIMDGIGNDNGRCEKDEVCYFVPDGGAFLRKPWEFTDTCVYDADGSALTGITIYGVEDTM